MDFTEFVQPSKIKLIQDKVQFILMINFNRQFVGYWFMLTNMTNGGRLFCGKKAVRQFDLIVLSVLSKRRHTHG